MLKYAGAAVVGAAAGAGLTYVSGRYGWIPGLTRTVTQTLTQTQTVTERITETVTERIASLNGRLFFDYNGNGIQDGEEPAVSEAKVQLKDNTGKVIADAVTDSAGDYKLEDIKVGSYGLCVEADKKFRYMCRSVKEFREVTEGYDVLLNEPGKMDIGLMEGFLTWPFLKGTKYTRNDYLGRDSVFDLDPTIGKIRAYNSTIPTTCTGSVCVADNHTGIDIGVNIGTHFAAAAPLTMNGFQSVSGNNGKRVGVINVEYTNDTSGRYAHAQLLPNIEIGQKIPRGKEFGYVERSDIGASHLHFELNKYVVPIDPYADMLDKNSLCYWTVFNNPQYSL